MLAILIVAGVGLALWATVLGFLLWFVLFAEY